MRWLTSTLLLIGMILSFRESACQAQQGEAPPEAAQTSPRYVPPSAWKSVEIGNYYLKRKKYNAALSRFKEAVTTDPYYAPAYLGLGKVYEKVGLRGKALKAYQTYLDDLPSTKDAEEAKSVHKAIERLESELKRSGSSRQGQAPQGK